MALPKIMVAPNGAHLGKADHPALPVTIAEIVACAAACWHAGAGGIHAHVRDADGQHVLDVGLYRELLAELALVVPEMAVQITTEAVGRYSPLQQRHLVETVRPAMVSVALREIIAEPDEACTTRFFSFCAEASIAVQHILYTAAEVDALAGLIARGVVAKSNLQILHVLGRYSAGQVSGPADLARPLARQTAVHLSADWAVCAFGQAETPCLLQALRAGGKVRVGFENNILHLDGTIARDNADRVRSVIQSAQAEGLPL